MSSLPKNLTIEKIMTAVRRDDMIGFCLACGNEQGGCEPDAQNHVCEDCGKREVYGAEQLLMMFA